MTCDLSPADLSAHLDGALPPDDAARVERHVLSCLACRERLGVWRGLDGALGVAPEAAPAALAAAPARHVRRVRMRRRALRAAAALACVAACGVAGVFGLDAGREASEVAARRTALERRVKLVDALELEAGSVRLELAALGSTTERETALADRLDDVLERLDRLRDDLEHAR